MDNLEKAVDVLASANHICAFIGTGIPGESGIHPFRGENWLWSRFDPIVLDIEYFRKDPKDARIWIKQIFMISSVRPSPTGYIMPWQIWSAGGS